MFPLSLAHLRFALEPKAPLHLPSHNKGNIIRGGFGGTFRRIVCHANCREPEVCELRAVCPYTAVFHPFVPEGSEKISRNRDIPRPFVIKPPLESKEIYQPGERLSFDMVLVGKASDYLPYFIVTFKELAQTGLGRTRAPVELVSVESIDSQNVPSLIYSHASNMVRPPRESISWDGLSGDSSAAREITVEFLTPTLLKADGRLVQKPEFAPLLKRLRDRINALAYFYCGQGLDLDFKQFGAAADQIVIKRDATRWIDTARYSRRRGVAHDLSGFIGEVTYAGELLPFLPYLNVGEYTHVGKNSVFGNGWYRIIKME